MGIGRVVGGSIAGLGLVGAGYAGLAGQDDTTRDDSGEVVEGGELGAFRIRLGDCFDDVLDGTFESVTAVPCAQSHVNEVYGAFFLLYGTTDPFPGDAAIGTAAETGCYERFAEFVGIAYESSVYEIGTITPTQGSWDEFDDREVLCLVHRTDGLPTVGSARGVAQ